MQKEIEAKFLDIDKDKIRKQLKDLGCKLIKPETLMKRKAFHVENDFEINRLRWARVRDEGDKITMTVKEIKSDGLHGVYESEVTIDSFEQGVGLLKGLDMVETAYQETLRELWASEDEKVYFMIDTWPCLNTVIEIESGDEDSVKKYSQLLGFDFKDAMFGGIDVVYAKVYDIDPKLVCKFPKITFDMSWKQILS